MIWSSKQTKKKFGLNVPVHAWAEPHLVGKGLCDGAPCVGALVMLIKEQ